MSEMNTANPRIPSPLTAGMITVVEKVFDSVLYI